MLDLYKLVTANEVQYWKYLKQ